MYTSRNNRSSRGSSAENNLHVTVPAALLTRIEQAAESERVTLDQFVAEAIERRLSRSWLDEAAAYGRERAKARGMKPSDVEGTIAEVRAEDETRGR